MNGSVQQPWQVQTGERYKAPKYLQPQGGKPMKLVLGPGCKFLCPPGAVRYNQKIKLGLGDDDKLFRKRGWALVKEKFVQEKKTGWNSLAANLTTLIDSDQKQERLNNQASGFLKAADKVKNVNRVAKTSSHQVVTTMPR